MYVNIDMYMKGRFDPGGVPSLRAFVADVVKDVPAGNSSVYDQWQQAEWTRLAASRRSGSVTAFEPDLKPLGSGADFVPFQDHLGVPTMAIEFIGDNGYGYGTYHSNYDSRAYVERVADPGFTQGVLMSRVLGTMALRMSQAEMLPFRFSDYAAKLDDAITLAEGWAREAATPIDVAALRVKATAVRDAAVALEAAIDERLRTGAPAGRSPPAVNDRLARMEQLLADDDGAPESKWYRHVFYGWNIYSLYDGQPFPGLAEALRLRDQARVTREMARDRARARSHAARRSRRPSPRRADRIECAADLFARRSEAWHHARHAAWSPSLRCRRPRRRAAHPRPRADLLGSARTRRRRSSTPSTPIRSRRRPTACPSRSRRSTSAGRPGRSAI